MTRDEKIKALLGIRVKLNYFILWMEDRIFEESLHLKQFTIFGIVVTRPNVRWWMVVKMKRALNKMKGCRDLIKTKMYYLAYS